MAPARIGRKGGGNHPAIKANPMPDISTRRFGNSKPFAGRGGKRCRNFAVRQMLEQASRKIHAGAEFREQYLQVAGGIGRTGIGQRHPKGIVRRIAWAPTGIGVGSVSSPDRPSRGKLSDKLFRKASDSLQAGEKRLFGKAKCGKG